MKTLKSILLLLLFSTLAYTQSPEAFNYQAILRDGAGDLLTNKNVAIQISLLADSETGTAAYIERFNAKTTQYGLVAVKLGKGSPQSGTFSTLDWGMHSYYVKIEVDPNNGTDFTAMGTSQLLSVPYALYAKTGGGDADADPANEIQTLSKSGTSISLSNGGGSITDAVDDADADATNELQNISLSDNTLTLSQNGGSVNLPTSGSSWTDNGSDYTYSNRNIGINTSTPSTDFEIYHSEGTSRMNHNSFAINSGTGDPLVLMTSAQGPGFLATYGTNNSVNTVCTYVSGSPNHGGIGVLDGNNNFFAGMQVSGDGTGLLYTEGPNGNTNFRAYRTTPGYENNGKVEVCDQNGDWQIQMYVATAGYGVIDADVKNFRMAHPNIPGTDIVYTCVEGPEVAAYVRGTATLSNGTVEIEFPEHFQIVASEIGLTVQITPLSADSRGLAVIQKNSEGFEVKELFDGIGNYSFDWEAKCIRKGYEDFEVLQENNEIQENMPETAK